MIQATQANKGHNQDVLAKQHDESATPPDVTVTVCIAKTSDSSAYDETQKFAEAHHLQVLEVSKKKRTIRLSGTPEDMQTAFKVELSHSVDQKTGRSFRAASGPARLPMALAPHVTAVLGFNTKPIAKPRIKLWPFGHKHDETASPEVRAKSLTALQVAKAYKFPTDVTGKGVTVAILELGGGYTFPDLHQYFEMLNVPIPQVLSKGVLGATNSPGDDADGEVLLDIQVAGAVAPGARYVVYFAPNTDQGFVDCILEIATDTEYKPQVLSISWGGAENTWSAQGRKAMNDALETCAENGVTVFVASGDDGAQDGQDTGLHADFPASSPFVTGVGGTRLLLNADGTIHSQTVWDDADAQEGSTGGGFSAYFPVPAYQEHIDAITKKGKRGVPDVASLADPETGFQVVIDGQKTVVGGTSSGAPLWAGYIALLLEKRGGKSLGLINPALYTAPDSNWWDIRSGKNDYTDDQGYSACKGWDACSGLGTPIGTRLEDVLVKV